MFLLFFSCINKNKLHEKIALFESIYNYLFNLWSKIKKHFIKDKKDYKNAEAYVKIYKNVRWQSDQKKNEGKDGEKGVSA